MSDGPPPGPNPEPIRIEPEPIRLTEEEVDRLMVWCVENDTSDITFQTNEPVWAEIHGRITPITRRVLSPAEVIDVLNRLYGANGAAQIASGKDIDVSYEIKQGRGKRYRFRVNGTGIMVDGADGVQITCRTMPEIPPDIDEYGIEDGIMDNCAPRQGLVLVTGPTGSGKSTLLSGIIRKLAEEPDGNRKILTYEAPIEFVYDEVVAPSSVVSQTEIPRHLPDFASGVRNALRRKPMIILVGEARDPETMAAAAEASLTGHLVYSTVHANGVAETVRRMISVFPADERQGRSIDLMESLRLIVTQILLRTVDGKRCACREFLPFTDDVRDKLLAMDVNDWPNATRQLIREEGQTMGQAAQVNFDKGLIDQRTLNMIKTREAAVEAMLKQGM
ncbi:MAG: Dot/Icm type IV secretion system ATPase DotB [Alphaproteobacteria bacterium]